ncbi:MAG: response regulator [SAR324 cluster bacterium]|nr:response regulator [SAR324 cluster bacterium]
MSAKILVVDDEQNLRDLIQFRLQAKGFAVENASNGAEAIEKAKANRPDLIVLDVMMPDLDGFAVLEIIKGEESGLKDVKVLLLSAKGAADDVEKGMNAGANGYMAKPFRAENLIEEIEKILEAN